MRPTHSNTILISNVYQNPRHLDPNCRMTDEQLQMEFDKFFEDFFVELSMYGELVEMHVCDNVGDHLIGNVYARYEWDEDAQRAVDALNARWYNSRPLFAELSPVADFREACCRQNETNECNRGGMCNFMHLRYATPSLVRELYHQLAVENRAQRQEKRQQDRTLRLGWKRRLAAEETDATQDSAPQLQSMSDWRSGPSGGDWRAEPADAHAAPAATPAA